MLPFTKLVGTGNDFIFIDLRTQPLQVLTPLSKERLAQVLCERHFGVGADGLIFVEKEDGLLKWDFFNRDGSKAEFCGNAARCFGRWAKETASLEEFIFKSVIGHIKISSRNVKSKTHFVVELHGLKALPKEIDLKLREFATFSKVISKLSRVIFVNTGVPHFVCQSKNALTKDEQLQLVSVFRFHSSAGMAGANVTFLCGEDTVTFERGVEDFTLSCGTGVVAAAVTLWKTEKALDVKLMTPGGPLRVEILEAKDDQITKANLIGPAELICEGKFAVESFTELEKK